MARLRTIEKRNNPQATELSQLIEELRRVSEKLECPESELAEALSNRPGTSAILWAIVSSPPIFNPVPSLSW